MDGIILCDDCEFYEVEYCFCKRYQGCMLCKGCSNGKLRKKSNAEKFRAMSDSEMAEFFGKIVLYCNQGKKECSKECPLYKCCNDQKSDNIEDWLREDAE